MHRIGSGAAAAAVLCGGAIACATILCAALAGPRSAAAQAVRVDTVSGWVVVCQGEEPIRRCSAARPAPFSDAQGREHTVTFNLMRDGGCTTLTGVFDQPIDPNRPVWLVVDGGPRLEFSAVPAGEGADFQRFLTRAGGGPAPSGTGVAPPGMVKETRRVGITCAGMRGLLPRLAAGSALHLEFSPAGMGRRVQPYHWPALSARAVDVPLSDVLARLTRHLQTP